MPPMYVALHVHSTYSFLDGHGQISKYVGRAVELGMPAIALTDHGNIHGWLDMHEEAGSKIKPILGCEMYQARKTRHDRDDEERNTSKSADALGQQHGPYHLTVLARNEVGYRNLIRLSSRAYLEGFYTYPRMDFELLDEHSEGLIVLSGCLNGAVQQALLRGADDDALLLAGRFQEIIGKDHFYIEVMDHGIPEERQCMEKLQGIARAIDAPIVVTGDCHYVLPGEAGIHDAAVCVSTQSILADESRFRFSGPHYYLHSPEEMARQFPEQWLLNTLRVADSVELNLKFGEFYFPDYPLPDGEKVTPYLERLVWDGMRRRYGDPIPEEPRVRAEHELEVVRRMGFETYFLVVWDLVNWAREQSIRVGPGRGSAAGCILSYALGITGLDPLRFNLLFERFLVEGRKSMPDIDLDFDDRHRNRVVEYARQRYGSDHVASICTFSTVQARSAIKDAARVMGYEYSVGDKISKLCPPPILGVSKSLDESLQTPDLASAYIKDPDAKKVIDMAKGLEGLYRQTGIHAAGVVISKAPTVDFVPVMQKGEDKPVLTQWDMDRVEQCGQLKIDFLALRNLAVIDLCIEMINERHGVLIDPDLLPLDDELTYTLLRSGHSLGVFQLESPGMRGLLLGMQPGCIEDLMALVSLYRPGPLGSGLDKTYIKRKNGKAAVSYDHPLMESSLCDTYGILLYQEQILAVARDLAGFSPGEADDLRKAIGKKQMDKIPKFRAAFVDGCKEQKISGAVANKIFGEIEYFGGYGFNASHAASYALIAYWTAYFKAHFPPEYMASLLSSVDDKRERAVAYLNEARRMGIKVLPPRMGTSGANFKVLTDTELLYGWSSVDGFGPAIVDRLIEMTGTYDNIFDFIRRCPTELLDRGTFDRLIYIGALDHLVTMECGSPARTRKAELMELERKYLKAYVTEHPLAASWIFLEPQASSTVAEVDDLPAGQKVTLAGVMSSVKQRKTRRGDMMYNFDIEDLTGRVNVVVFPKDASHLNPVEGEIVFIDGRLTKSGDDDHPVTDVLFEGIRRPQLPEDLGGAPIKLRTATPPEEGMIDKLSAIIGQYPGDSPVYLEFSEGTHTVTWRFNELASYEAEMTLRTVLQ